jgi:hypothetical protein
MRVYRRFHKVLEINGGNYPPPPPESKKKKGQQLQHGQVWFQNAECDFTHRVGFSHIPV